LNELQDALVKLYCLPFPYGDLDKAFSKVLNIDQVCKTKMEEKHNFEKSASEINELTKPSRFFDEQCNEMKYIDSFACIVSLFIFIGLLIVCDH
jgi:hypothetical protein